MTTMTTSAVYRDLAHVTQIYVDDTVVAMVDTGSVERRFAGCS